MMKKFFIAIFVFVVLFSGYNTFAASDPMDTYNIPDYYTNDLDNAVDSTEGHKGDDITNPLRQGVYKIVEGKEKPDHEIKGIIKDQKIQNFSEAQKGTLSLIKRGVNYSLSFVALVALIYLIYHGFLMLTAMGDDGKYKKGFKGLKNAAIALSGIGLSWLIVSFIFWLLEQIVG